MINVYTKRKCEDCGKKIPCFNFQGEKAKYCGDCKKTGMINVSDKKCECGRVIPNFNYEGERPRFCKECKEDGMIDITHKKCHCGSARASFNVKGQPPVYCAKCKSDDMIDLTRTLCITCDNNQAAYNYEGLPALYCSKCREEDMIHVLVKRCKSVNCPTYANKKYDDYCARPLTHIFPDDKRVRLYKIKEQHVVDFVRKSFPRYQFSFDKQIKDTCHRRKPDIFLECLTHTIIIEIDEDQHRTYGQDTHCEIVRINELFTGFADRPMILIRFNPDAYYDKNGKKVISCFKNHKTSDMPIIENESVWMERLNVLKKTISYHIRNVPADPLTVKYLFYSEI